MFLPLTNSWREFEIDDEDGLLISKHKWRLQYSRDWKPESITSTNVTPYKTVYLARYLLGLTDPHLRADHKDRNPLNNKRENLRIATPSQNSANCTNPEGRFKGVYKRYGGKYRGEVKFEGKRYRALFKTAEEAARWRDKKALELQGEFASLNFPIKENK